MYYLGKEHTYGSPRCVYQAVYQNLPLYCNYNSHLFSVFRVHYLQGLLSGMKYRSDKVCKSVSLFKRNSSALQNYGKYSKPPNCLSFFYKNIKNYWFSSSGCFANMIIYSEIMPIYQLFSKTIFLLKRETPFCSTIPVFFIVVAVSHRNTIAINSTFGSYFKPQSLRDIEYLY